MPHEQKERDEKNEKGIEKDESKIHVSMIIRFALKQLLYTIRQNILPSNFKI